MKSLYLAAIIIFFVGFTQAQHNWFSGSVVLKNNTVLVGEISKKPIHDLILVKDQSGTHALPAHQVSYYRFYDSDSNINRQFLSVHVADFFNTSKFFEIVIPGNVKILRRFHKKTPFDELNEAYDFDFFVFLNNTLTPLNKFKNEVYPKLLEKHPLEISTFVDVNQLRITTIKSAFSIIKYYNEIDKKSDLLAQMD